MLFDSVKKYLTLNSRMALGGASLTITYKIPHGKYKVKPLHKALHHIRQTKGVRLAYVKFRKNEILLKVIFAKDAK